MAARRKKTLVIDARMVHFSGIGTYLKNLIPQIIDQFNGLLLGAASDLAEFEWAKRAEIIETTSRIYTLREQAELPFKIPRSDGFWSPHYNIPVLPLRAKKRIVTIHDVFHLAFYRQLSLRQKIYARQMFRSLAHQADRIITVSHFSKSEICKYTGISPDSVSVIYNGVDQNRFKRCNDASLIETVKRKYHLPERFILFVGNVKPHKNLKRLVLAYQKLKGEISGARLVIIGKKEGLITVDKELFELLENDSSLEENVIFKSGIPDDDLPVFYQLASVFVFPSLYEGFGFPPLEAMACGCPAVVSHIESLAEICAGAVLYIDPLSPDDIAGKLSQILNDENLHANLRQKGFERVQRFDWEASAREHLEVLEKALVS